MSLKKEKNQSDSSLNPLSEQVGGSHYKTMKIQPVEFIMENDLGFCEGNAVKYLCRYKQKGGLQDLHKAKHYIEILIEMMEKWEAEPQNTTGKDE
ncbi:DUF3310 domain-containing protein [Candidatus Dependentiae bacterium]|nr:MAG: DUF3310 domain-containing protein [Candidatus Dependentiae bacterium]